MLLLKISNAGECRAIFITLTRRTVSQTRRWIFQRFCHPLAGFKETNGLLRTTRCIQSCIYSMSQTTRAAVQLCTLEARNLVQACNERLSAVTGKLVGTPLQHAISAQSDPTARQISALIATGRMSLVQLQRQEIQTMSLNEAQQFPKSQMKLDFYQTKNTFCGTWYLPIAESTMTELFI